MLTAEEIRGLYAIVPTPATDGAAEIEATATVDLAKTEAMIESLIRDGAQGLIALGTTGECATLSTADWQTFVALVLEVVGGRIPTFIGATALGGHEVASRVRFIRSHGGDGTLLGLPMWQPLTTRMAVDFYRQLSDAFPDVAIMVYANSRAFRYSFPIEFWTATAQQAPTVVAAKYSRPKSLTDLLAAVDGEINIVPNETTAAAFYATSPSTTTAIWATAAAMGPAPVLALAQAIEAGDGDLVNSISAELAHANEPMKPIFGDPEVFASYNLQVEKARINAAGYCDCGPCRPPYHHLPQPYAEAAAECGRRWRSLRHRFAADGSQGPTLPAT